MTSPDARTAPVKALPLHLTTTRLSFTLHSPSNPVHLKWWLAFFNDKDVISLMGDMNLRTEEEFTKAVAPWSLIPDVHNGYAGLAIYLLKLRKEGEETTQEEEKVEDYIGFASVRNTRHFPDLGYGLMPPYWGNGYATEAGKRIFALLKEELGIERFIGYAGRSNEGSIKVLSKVGFVRYDKGRDGDGMEEVDGNVKRFRSKFELFVLPGMEELSMAQVCGPPRV